MAMPLTRPARPDPACARPLPLFAKAVAVCGLMAAAWARAGEPVPLDDASLADVTGRDGIGFAVHIEMNSALLNGVDLNSRMAAGFEVNGVKTYAIAGNFGGIIDLFAMTLNLRTRPDGSDYLDIGLPFFIGISQFGYRSFTVQTNPDGPLTHNYGQLLLDGHAAMKGHLYVWAQ